MNDARFQSRIPGAGRQRIPLLYGEGSDRRSPGGALFVTGVVGSKHCQTPLRGAALPVKGRDLRPRET